MSEPAWRASVLTLFPELFPGPLGASLAGKALCEGKWRLSLIDIRDFAAGKHRQVDSAPAGGGPGMVLRADVAAAALDHALKESPGARTMHLSPRGAPLTQERVRKLAAGQGVVLLCSRFEGIDERLLEARDIEEISVGDYVLSGGEIAAMALIDAVVRLLPGVMGDRTSEIEESFETGLLEYPHYTKPALWEERPIPEILTSGDHGRVADWRRAQAEEITRTRRPDLWDRYKKAR